MNVYRSGSEVSVTIDLTTDSGKLLTPSAVTYRLVDQDGVELQVSASVPGFVEGDSSVTIAVSAAINTLAVDVIRSLVTIRLSTVEQDSSNGYIEQSYIVEADDTMVVGTNSYQSLGSAKLLAEEMPELEGWVFATDRGRKSSLNEAYERIGKLRFIVDGVNITSVNEMDAVDFDALSSVFRYALKKAQLSEADIILGGDPVHKKREEGLLSDSVGESSIMFRPGKPLLLSVSRRSMNYLSGFITYGTAIGRV